METDLARAELRPRRSFEAIDLGLVLVRNSWRSILGAWLTIVAPICTAVIVALASQPFLALFIIWWLKPAFDRVPLHVLSIGLFGPTPSVRETIAASARLANSGLLASLTVLRFTPARSLLLPVLQLEGLRQERYRARSRTLAAGQVGVAAALGLVCALIHLLTLGAGSASFLIMMLPHASWLDAEALVTNLLALETDTTGLILLPILYSVGLALIEPFYVGGGFGLYINRRVFLEGWDIEQVFRRLALRVEHAPRTTFTLAIGSALAVGMALAPGLSSSAQASEQADSVPHCESSGPSDAKACIERVLAHPDFTATRTIEIWAPRNAPENLTFNTGPTLGGFLSRFLWLLVSVLGVAAVLVLTGFWLRDRPSQTRPRGHSEPVHARVAIEPRPLPELGTSDPIDAARSLWNRADRAGALGLLYRAAVRYLVEQRDLEIPASATEGQCTRLARRHMEPGLADAFDQLTRAWLYCRYGDAPPESASFEALCTRWREHLGRIS